MERHEIVQLLGAWAEREGPLYERLAFAFEQVIRSGELPVQTRLPSERWLAQHLGVSRSTIVAAYTRLQEKGWVTTRQGSGTQVAAFSPQRSLRLRRQQLHPLARGTVVNAYLSGQLESIDLSTGAPSWPTGFDAELCALEPEQVAPLLQEYGYMPQGLPQLRQMIASYYTDSGVRTQPEQILVTTGAQQAISLLATLLVQRGDTVIVENPTFFGAIDTFRAAGARLAAVPVGASGLDFHRLEELLSARTAQFVYLMPSFHNPTGNTLSDMQRREIVRLAQKFNMLLIEDLTLANNALEREPPAPLAAYAPDGDVITIGSMSKIFWAGLRVGWIRGSVTLIERLARLKAITDLGSSLITQLLATQLLPHLEQVKRLRRQELTPRRDLLLGVLHSKAPTWNWQRPQGGLFVWAQLPAGDARDLAQEALRSGVIVTPGTILSVDETHTAWLRLPYLLPPDRLQIGLERLMEAWERYERRRETAPERL
jgi:DNA-binding transcriptional MocR family regulator